MKGSGSRRTEAGETLVELLVTIVIMGIAFTGVLAGLGMAAVSSGVHREAATGETLVRDAAETLLDPAVAYVPCATTASYGLKGLTIPKGYAIAVREVGYWDGQNPARYPTALATCPSADNGVQRLTIAVTSTDARAATESVEIIKRSP